MKEIKDIIKNRREELGLTLTDVADYVGVSVSTIMRWENGDIANMKRDKIVKLSKALEISPAVIMGWSETAAELRKDEQTLLRSYNQLDLEDKKEVLNFIEYKKTSDKYKKDTKEA